MECKEVQNCHDLPRVIFVYGTLKRGQPNHCLMKEFGNHHFLGIGHTDLKYPLIIDTEFNLPFLLDAPGKGQIVHGEIYCVDDEFLSRLDVFEGCPHLYQRDVIKVHITPNSESKDKINVCSSTGNENMQVVQCNTYMRKDFSQSLLDKETFSSYDAFGSHGLLYDPENDHSDGTNTEEALGGGPCT